VVDYQELMKILGNYRFYRGFNGGRSPPMPKDGHFEAEGLFIGWVGKYSKIVL
jgi:hypothetical protein